MLGLKLIHVSKRGLRWISTDTAMAKLGSSIYPSPALHGLVTVNLTFKWANEIFRPPPYIKSHRVTPDRSPHDNTEIRLQKCNKEASSQLNLLAVGTFHSVNKFTWRLCHVNSYGILAQCLFSVYFYCSCVHLSYFTATIKHGTEVWKWIFPVEISLAYHLAPYWPPYIIYTPDN